MIDVNTLKTLDDVKQHSLKDLFDLYSKIRPDHGLKKFYDKKQAAKHILTFLSDQRWDDPTTAPSGGIQPVTPEEAARLCEPTSSEPVGLPGGEKTPASNNGSTGPVTASKRRRRGSSYQDKIKAAFEGRESVTEDELLKAVGCDRKNLGVAVSILKNPTRTPEPLALKFDRQAKVFKRIEG